MADTIDQWFVVSFSDMVTHKAQQVGARFLSHVTLKTGVRGERHSFPLLDQMDDREITGEKFTAGVAIDAPAESRSAFKRDFEWRTLIDRNDDLRILLDPEQPYAEASARASNRRSDSIILEATLGTAKKGKNADTDVAFPSGNVVDATATGLTVAKMLELRQAFDTSEEMIEDMEQGDRDAFVLAVAPKAHEQLLNETQTTSRDFYEDPIFGQLPLVNGRIPFFAGFRIRVTNKLTKVGTTRYNVAWHRSAMGLAMWQEAQMFIEPRADLTARPNQVLRVYSLGAVRLKESGVFRIDTTE